MFAETIEQLGQIDDSLDMFRRLIGRVLIALNGSEVSLFAEDPLPALLDAGQKPWRDQVFPQHAGGHAGGTQAR